MRPPSPKPEETTRLEAALAVLLDEFFSSGDVSVEWRTILDEESINVMLGQVASGQVEISGICFVADGVSQLAPLRPFNSVRCAAAIRRALSGGE